MLYYLAVTIYVLVCLLLIVVILLQQGKGGDIANAFGGGGSQAAFGARAGATLLTKMTTVLAGLFIAFALTLAAWGQLGPSSVVGGRAPTAPAPAAPAPAAPAPAPAPAPTTPAPAK